MIGYKQIVESCFGLHRALVVFDIELNVWVEKRIREIPTCFEMRNFL